MNRSKIRSESGIITPHAERFIFVYRYMFPDIFGETWHIGIDCDVFRKH